jgi:hypothetical protein
VAGQTRIVCDVRSAVGRPEPSDDGRDFGTYPKDSDTLAWLWMKDRANSSRLLVIATRFLEGNHYATSPRDFVPVVEHLEQLHAAGFVHGDIRCFSMAMGPVGGLFDFDLGGKLANGDGETSGVRTYPVGYNHDLPDGARLGGADMPITKYHDVYALTRAIFACHDFRPNRRKVEPAELSATTQTNEDLRVDKESSAKALSETELQLRLLELIRFGVPSEEYEQLPAAELEEKISTHLADVKKFLEDASSQQWIVHPQPTFKRVLVKHGFFDAPRDGLTRRPSEAAPLEMGRPAVQQEAAPRPESFQEATGKLNDHLSRSNTPSARSSIRPYQG